jgi:MutS-like protein
LLEIGALTTAEGKGTAHHDPAAEYRRRLDERQAQEARLARRDRAIADLRLGIVGLGLLMAWLAIGPGILAPWWLLLPVFAFFTLLVIHDRVIQQRGQAARAAAFYDRGLARLENRWAGTGVTGERFRDESHPYAGDLDLFGKGSLFELLCTARTHAGQETLATWLLGPSSPDVVRRRQEAVTDLRPRLDLREDLALLGEDVRTGVDVRAVVAWGSAPILLTSRGVRITGGVLAALTLGAAAAWAAGMGPIPLIVMVAIEQAFLSPVRGRVRQVVRSVEQPGRELALFARLLERLEAEQFDAPLLRDLHARLDAGGAPSSQKLARLERLVSLLDAQRNGVFALLGLILLWPMQLAFEVEKWREECGKDLGNWLTTVGELEALSALAGYSYEHPQDPFPAILEAGACFEAEGLGHPLLSEAVSVRNDISLGEETRLLIVSGSNMSGKSTLLRTIGTNTVLALAGAPVRARHLRLAPVTVGASLRIQDSLQAGTSRFYAEITRLRQIVSLADGPFPLLFLLDEILHGTNSHDRRIGAEAVVRALVLKGAIGLVTTHDLALARIAEDPTVHAVNVHFEDHLEEGKMCFDYRLRPGVVLKSNALELMRAVGLEV